MINSSILGLPHQLIDGVTFYPPTLRDIMEREVEYQFALSLILNIKKTIELPEHLQDFSEVELLNILASESPDFEKLIVKGLEFFTRVEWVYIPDNEKFVCTDIDNVTLTEGLWLALKSATANENHVDLNKLEEDEDKPKDTDDERVKKLREKLKKTKQRVSEYKSKTAMTLWDEVACVCARSNNISILEAYKLTIYQLHAQWMTLLNIEKFEINLSILQGGGSVKDSHHWSETN